MRKRNFIAVALMSVAAVGGLSSLMVSGEPMESGACAVADAPAKYPQRRTFVGTASDLERWRNRWPGVVDENDRDSVEYDAYQKVFYTWFTLPWVDPNRRGVKENFRFPCTISFIKESEGAQWTLHESAIAGVTYKATPNHAVLYMPHPKSDYGGTVKINFSRRMNNYYEVCFSEYEKPKTRLRCF